MLVRIEILNLIEKLIQQNSINFHNLGCLMIHYISINCLEIALFLLDLNIGANLYVAYSETVSSCQGLI